MDWNDKIFSELSTKELFQIYKLRAEVFNAEQESSYPDPDNNDLIAHHVFATENGELAAYGRYFPEDGMVTFGRIVVAPNFRKKGLGNELIFKIMGGIKAEFPNTKIFIHAQLYVAEMYKKFDFETKGAVFIEADRKHIMMYHDPLN
ncbi:GNAT family N-acetyltransferase [Lactobacillus kalixensis]|uniref:GCN5-related N-acetyltransferase n=1 Tax=Lactobacillus kalixensis DSM 16043 TaxID=1423763 RepID=A0A0R1U923_9LACO|nr:GNAT family N-acetyltransferase [Lactobacillus kalixensis]KRL89820.1 GCN5-related N-acetyltransferase [Lactobacillus kalixensis DSM 16043]